jgi:hypothetical protein
MDFIIVQSKKIGWIRRKSGGIAFLPGRDRILGFGGSTGYRLAEWDVFGRRPPRIVGDLHMRWTRWISASADGRIAATGGEEASVKLWDLQAGREMLTLSDYPAHVKRLALSSDGTVLLASSADLSVRAADFTRQADYRRMLPAVERAQATLQGHPDEVFALTTLGEWHAFRRRSRWASELLMQARAGGARVSPLTLARCRWTLGDVQSARKEFLSAVKTLPEGPERRYVVLCLRAVGDDRSEVTRESSGSR